MFPIFNCKFLNFSLRVPSHGPGCQPNHFPAVLFFFIFFFFFLLSFLLGQIFSLWWLLRPTLEFLDDVSLSIPLQGQAVALFSFVPYLSVLCQCKNIDVGAGFGFYRTPRSQFLAAAPVAQFLCQAYIGTSFLLSYLSPLFIFHFSIIFCYTSRRGVSYSHLGLQIDREGSRNRALNLIQSDQVSKLSKLRLFWLFLMAFDKM